MTTASFLEIRLEFWGENGAQAGPAFNTSILERGNGYEKRNANWSAPRRSFSTGDRTQNYSWLEYLINFQVMTKGAARGFRFRDPSDFDVTNGFRNSAQTGFQTRGTTNANGNGSNKVFQLQKSYANPIETNNRAIKKPVQGTVHIFVNGTESTAWTLDYTTGLVTFNAAPSNGAVVNWAGQFDVPVRFENDDLIQVLRTQPPDRAVAKTTWFFTPAKFREIRL
ncbi:DUF2460 domain-containing protein [Gloeobacter kilaueensis]|uniref:DUF2460 domain-containing protein n=1 Tax=Gloeobacter kilaueensis (strain ATCC BAA-2537 / CCAP 1431/1 / ULC 316 / JS1) TaxID=1183438 RepID=U5QHK9_GLOK1|nr:DUF2460 domain-containing protein [Gloeobacter kilaueensis]AGY57155.1 hypothetical protein GKIL_0909 [Gloeobacter kilaueensis JS1]